MCKKAISSLLALACCLSFPAAALAQTPETADQMQIVAPRLDSGNAVDSSLSISGASASLSSTVDGKAGTTKIVVTQVLQKKSGSRYSDVSGKSWTKTESKKSLRFSNSCTVDKGVTYRVKTTAKITGSKGTDTVTKYSTAVTCK